MHFIVRVMESGKPVVLGVVSAEHQPAAVQEAWKQWPRRIKNDIQGGFSVLPVPAGDAIKIYESAALCWWAFGEYRITTYPNSNIFRMVRLDNTAKRVWGRKLDTQARAALTKAGWAPKILEGESE